MLEIKNVTKIFNKGTVNEKVALDDFSLTLEDGDFVTVIGGNGSGKSTMMNAIAGVWPVDEGRIVIDGIDVTKLPEHKRAKYLGRVFQDPMTGTAATMGIEENLALANRRGQRRTLRPGITAQEREKFRKQLAALGLGLEDRMTSKVGLLSGGQRQALTLLMATLKKPRLLLLDEPSLGLAPLLVRSIFETVRAINGRGVTVLLVEQNARAALKLATRGYVLEVGKVVMEDRAENLLADASVREAYLGG